MAKSLIERFEEKYIADPNSGCWIWTAYLRKDGYGEFQMGTNRKSNAVLAHRASYELFVGAIPDGLDLDHKCRQRCCVNPSHLEPVTRGENIRRGAISDMNRRAFDARTHCKNGHEYNEINTRFRIIGKSRHRFCRPCLAADSAKRRASISC